VGSYWLGISGRADDRQSDLLAQPGGAGGHLLAGAESAVSAIIMLLKRAHVPRLLTEQILLTWRFIFILLDEALAIHRAQTLRFGYRSLPLGYRSLAMLVGLLFTRVLIRYQQMSTTLDIKLYQGDFHL
jgi:cobalt/nickel transport system permease protein